MLIRSPAEVDEDFFEPPNKAPEVEFRKGLTVDNIEQLNT
jgi:hypothetical protein